jgi:hypothetical protein
MFRHYSGFSLRFNILNGRLEADVVPGKMGFEGFHLMWSNHDVGRGAATKLSPEIKMSLLVKLMEGVILLSGFGEGSDHLIPTIFVLK